MDMKNKIIIAVLAVLLMGTYSCRKLYQWNQPKDPVVEYPAIWPLAGEWYVLYQFDDGAGNIGDEIPTAHPSNWIFDYENGVLKFENDPTSYGLTPPFHKADCDLGARTFSGDSLVSTADGGGVPYNIKINVKNGKVIEDGGHSTSGVVSGSIYFEIEYQDDPGTIYYCAGVRRTGFLEDEH